MFPFSSDGWLYFYRGRFKVDRFFDRGGLDINSWSIMLAMVLLRIIIILAGSVVESLICWRRE